MGDRVLISAGHCFESMKEVTVADSAGVGHQGICTNLALGGSKEADLAACYLYDPVRDTTFETVASSVIPIKQGDELLIVGLEPGNAQSLVLGRVLVEQDPLASKVIETVGEAWLTPADSGHGAFRLEAGRRRLVAVNNAVERSKGRSVLTRLEMLHEALRAWKHEVESHHGLKNAAWICGVDASRASCRP